MEKKIYSDFTYESESFIHELFRKRKAAALTGAGISEESGISTFRGDNGIWKRYNPAIYANLPGLGFTLLVAPHKVINFITEVFDTLINAKPNPGHFALAELENQGILSSIITQNIDNLHQEVGSKRVIELHGNMFEFRCMKCNCKRKLSKGELASIMDELKNSRKSLFAIKKILIKCNCGGKMRPNAVLFGEVLDQTKISDAYKEINNNEVLLIIGTSGVVYPAAYLPWYAKEIGKTIIEINPDRSKFSEIANYFVKGKAGEVLPSVIEQIFGVTLMNDKEGCL